MKSFLDRLPMLQSRDVEETRAYLAGKAIGLDLLERGRGARRMDTRVNGAYLPGMWIGYIQYGAAVNIQLSPKSSVWLDGATAPIVTMRSATADGDYWLHMPVQGDIEARVGGERIDCDPRCGIVASPSSPHVLRVAATAARFSLEIRGEALHRQLAALLGDTVSEPLQFGPAIRLDTGNGRSLAGFVRFAVQEIERLGPRWSQLLVAQFEQFILCSLLLSQPNNYSKALRLRERPIAPRDVRRAIDYIHENLAEAITLADLVAVSGVAGRTLLKHFRDFKGVSPMRYIRNLRLERVRDELASGAADQVLVTAERWGFAHAGRFSVEYRRRFGESPSATLENGRRR